MTVANEVLDDIQLGEELGLKALEFALIILGKDRAHAELDAAAIGRANAIATIAEDAKVGPPEPSK